MPVHLQTGRLKCRPITTTGFIIFVLHFIFAGCKKFVNVNPPVSSVPASTVYSNNASAAAVMTGVYVNMIEYPALSSGDEGVSFLEGLAADELTNYGTASKVYTQFYEDALRSASSGSSNSYYWREIYQEIYVTNAVTEGLANSSGITASMKHQLDGEARFIRAFYFFYAVNLYGDVPLALTTDYMTNNSIKRTPKAQVYQQIIKDLTTAQTELGDNFVDASGNTTTERIRPNKGAAEALLARVYLYTGDWVDAEKEADLVINNTTNYTLLTDLSQVFLKNSQESIWQLQSITPGQNTWDAQYFVLYQAPGTNYISVALSGNLIGAFEPNDARFSNWVNSYTDNTGTYYYAFKYENIGSNLTEYLTVFRLAEQYLIRAEARAEQNNIPGAQADLDTIRSRAGLANTTASDKQSLLTAILHERRIELFTEWGHRWFDLIRTGSIDSVMGNPGNMCQAKGGTWSQTDTLAPLPLSELQVNANLTQNPGYN